jgi:hypothetical protein
MKRLDANNNSVDCEQETPEKMIECFKHNKYLEEVRFKFCNLNEQYLIKMCEGIR